MDGTLPEPIACDLISVGVYFKLKKALVGGYRGMSGYWNEYGTHNIFIIVPYVIFLSYHCSAILEENRMRVK